VSPGGTGIHRQVVPQRNPETPKNKMHRLAVSGNFPETRNLTEKQGFMHNHHIIIIQFMLRRKN